MTSETLSKQNEYFSRLAKFGTTKHGGGLISSLEMLALAQVKEGDYVLDVGCGMGLTPIYIAKNIGARVMGVDMTPQMVELAREEAKHRGAIEGVEFQVADAQDLPFDDNTFDAIIIESVNIFVPDVPRAMREYLRVLKPGGYLAMNEGTWFDGTNVDFEEFADSIGGTFRTSEEWQRFLHEAGFTAVEARVRRIKIGEETVGRWRRFGWGGIWRSLRKVIHVLRTDKETVDFLKSATQQTTLNDKSNMAYGIYVGRKPKH